MRCQVFKLEFTERQYYRAEHEILNEAGTPMRKSIELRVDNGTFCTKIE